MLPKPPGCVGCPLYGDGFGFVPDKVVEGAFLCIIAQNPGEYEERGLEVTEYQGKLPITRPHAPEPLIGPTGFILARKFLPLAGFARDEVSLCNVLRCRVQTPSGRVNTMPTGVKLEQAKGHCSQYLRIPESTKLIVAHGAYAWDYLGGPGSITDWRGYLSPKPVMFQSKYGVDNPREFPVYGTLHTADLAHNSTMTIVAQRDWAKIPCILSGAWPEPFPPTVLLHDMAWADISTWASLAEAAPFVVLDAEWVPGSNYPYLIGLGYPGGPILQYEWWPPGTTHLRRDEAISVIASILERAQAVVMHNALADVPILAAIGIGWDSFRQLDDSMQFHAVLWAELPHTLEFCDSLYGRYEKRKHLSREDNLAYNAGDVASTICVWEALLGEGKQDPRSYKVYRDQMRLLPHLDESMKIGIAVDTEKVAPLEVDYTARMAEGEAMAQAYCGYPINLNSPQQLQRWLFDLEGLKVAKHPKTKKPTVDKDAIAVMRAKYIDVDPQEEVSVAGAVANIEAGGHPLLESLRLYGEAEHALSHYITPLIGKDRIFHTISVHSQANARWSYTDPPLAQLPKDLRSLFTPDPGWPWFGWDHDQIELRLVAAYSGDKSLLEAFAKNWDVHLMATIAMFALQPIPTLIDPIHAPENAEWLLATHWRKCDHAHDMCGKDDPRRHFCKTFGHRQSYGGTAGRSGSIPGAKQLGLTARHLEQMSMARSALFPGIITWQNTLVADAMRSGETRTWAGRRRRFLARQNNYLKGEMLDHPMQAGCQDLENSVFLEIKDTYGSDVRYVYGLHDSQWWAVRESEWDRITPGIEAITTQLREINGITMSFPAVFKARNN